jgi:predicted outer membrane repeat protein
MLRPFLITTTVLGLSTAVLADTIQIGPGDSIQEAIGGAADGDAIIVEPGTYHEAIDFLGKAVTLSSAGGAEVTTIDATGLGNAAVTARSGEGPDTVLDGFTVTGGTGRLVSGRTFGGGMYIKLSDPTVRHCVFTGNTADAGGGLAAVSVSFGEISDCLFTDNTATAGGSYGGGGMYMQGSYSPVINCIFDGNRAVGAAKGGGLSLFLGHPIVANCLIVNNEARHGGGIMNTKADPTITNTTFSGNTAAGSGGAMRCIYESSITRADNCIFWGNHAGTEGDEILDQAGAVTTVSYSTVRGGWFGSGSNNADADPMFADAAAGNFRLAADSPCIDAGTNDAVSVATDLDGNARIFDDGVVDLGAYETQVSGGPDCPADLDGDDAVEFDDLVLLLHAWGSCAGCPADQDGDGAVDFDDMLMLLNAWGQCH